MAKSVLLSVSDPSAVERELEPLGARVAIRLPGNLIVAHVPESFQLPKSERVRLAADAELDEEGELFARAFVESLAILESDSPGLQWDAEGALRSRAVPPSTSLVMNGNIAVGIVVVSGPTNDLKITAAENGKITAQCLKAFDYLSRANPLARLRFTPKINCVSIAEPKPVDASNEVFIYRSLPVLGYANSVEYAEALQRQTGEDWGYVAFFTKYPTPAPYYANTDYVVMQYSEPISSEIYRIFAHESCHIFGAADEYVGLKANCECGEPFGYLGAPNNNCEKCFPDGAGQTACLMNRKSLGLCTWSRRQIGWNAWSAETSVTAQVGATAAVTPALAQYKGQVWMVYRADDSASLYATSYDGAKWNTPAPVDNGAESMIAVGLAVYGPPTARKLWMVHKGKESTTLWASEFNGIHWAPQTKITVARSSDTPALAEFDGKLWMAYRDEDTTDLCVCSFDGATWSAPTKPGAKTLNAPALAVYGHQLRLVYHAGRTSSSDIWTCSYDGATWSDETNITQINGAKSEGAPALGVLGDVLWLVYKDAPTANFNMSYCAYDGKAWLPPAIIGIQNRARTWAGVGVAPLHDVLVAAYLPSFPNISSCSLQQDAKVT